MTYRKMSEIIECIFADIKYPNSANIVICCEQPNNTNIVIGVVYNIDCQLLM